MKFIVVHIIYSFFGVVMKFKRILGTVFLIVGIALIGTSFYIKGQVEDGKLKINKAQGQVDQGSSLFNQNPITKQVGKGLTKGAQKKIDAGKDEVSYYEQVAGWTKIGGIVFIVLGLGTLFFSRKR